ncbi:MAG: cytochrome-c peroxidase [Gammaproteobacteria bacterium]
MDYPSKTKNTILSLSLLALIQASTVTAGALNDKAQLGELLYFDTDLSLNKNQSCASCHTPKGFADPKNAADPKNSVVSDGSVPGLHGGRNAPSSAYAAFTPIFHWTSHMAMYMGGQFWDGRSATLTDQAQGPFLNPVEMAMPSKGAVLMAIGSEDNKNNSKYTKLFLSVYDITLENFLSIDNTTYVNAAYVNVADAIAAFEKSKHMSEFSSKYDHFLAGNTTLSTIEKKGMDLFNGKAKCSNCHTSKLLTAVDGSDMPPLFANYTYHNIGIPKSTNPLIANDPIDNGLGGRADIAANDPDGAQLGKHKVVTLRNIALTAPYGHNGYFASLKDIVHFYNTRDVGDWAAPEVSKNMMKMGMIGDLGLTSEEEAAVVAFMETLTDGFDMPLNSFPFPPFP